MDLKVITIPVGPLSANCHIVYSNEQSKALIIDSGGDFSLIQDTLKRINKQAGAVILTHCHFDHVMATAEFAEIGVPVYMHEKDVDFITNSGNLAKYFGLKLKPFIVDNRLIGGDIDICGYKITIIETPGHTEGGICIKIQNLLFTGDTLFKSGCGRTDFPSGNELKLIQSAKRLFAIEEDLILYTGHGEATTLEKERKTNPINLLF